MPIYTLNLHNYYLELMGPAILESNKQLYIFERPKFKSNHYLLLTTGFVCVFVYASICVIFDGEDDDNCINNYIPEANEHNIDTICGYFSFSLSRSQCSMLDVNKYIC